MLVLGLGLGNEGQVIGLNGFLMLKLIIVRFRLTIRACMQFSRTVILIMPAKVGFAQHSLFFGIASKDHFLPNSVFFRF